MADDKPVQNPNLDSVEQTPTEKIEEKVIEFPLVGEVPLSCEFCVRENNVAQYLPGVTLKYCPQCKKAFCTSHASRITPQYCKECVNDVVIKESTFTRTEEEYDEVDDKVIVHTQSAKQITFEGMHWTFYTKVIQSLTDEELKNAFEFHRAIVYQLQNDIETRKVKKTQGLKLGTTVNIRKTKEVKKTTEKRQKSVTPESIAAQLKSAGVSAEALLALLQKIDDKKKKA